MGWIDRIRRRLPFPADTRVVARFASRIEGEGQPVGSGHASEGNCENLLGLLDEVTLARGVSAGEAIRTSRVPELDRWLSSANPDPLPRALVRLLFDAHQKGIAVTPETSISAFWHEGRPPRSVWDGPATVAQIWQIQIRLFFAEAGHEGYRVIDFDP